MDKRIKNIIFDFGGIIVDLDKQAAVHAFEALGFEARAYINDYVQYVKSDFLAGLGFGATQQLGETTGIYMGYSVDTGRNVYLQPSLASQGVKGTVTNALASAFVGSLGGGSHSATIFLCIIRFSLGDKRLS